jgi:hypothetical protein
MFTMTLFGALSPLSAIHRTQARNRVQLAVRQLGDALIELLYAVSNVEQNPHDVEQCKLLTAKVSFFHDVISSTGTAVHAGFRGTQTCINGIAAVIRMQVELDAIMSFALAKAHGFESKNLFVYMEKIRLSQAFRSEFRKLRDLMIRQCKTFVDSAKQLAGSCTQTQASLAEASDGAIVVFKSIVDSARSAALALGATEADAQVLLIEGASDIGLALRLLFLTCKEVVGRELQVLNSRFKISSRLP